MELHSYKELQLHKDEVAIHMVDYYSNFLAKPHKNLGRTGAVCPFVPISLRFNKIWTVLGRNVTSTQEILSLVDQLKALQSKSDVDSAYVLVLPHLTDFSLVDNLQRKLKLSFVASGLMIGEFHPEKESPGLWSTSFRPLKSKYPMLVIRSLLEQDFVFMAFDHYSFEEKWNLLEAFLKYYPSNLEALRLKRRLSYSKGIKMFKGALFIAILLAILHQFFRAMSYLLEPPSTPDKIMWDLWLNQHCLASVTVGIEIGVFTLLHDSNGLDIHSIAEALKINNRGAESLLAVLCGLKFVTKELNKFMLTSAAKTYLVPESDFYWRPMLATSYHSDYHHRLLKAIQDNSPWEGAVVRKWETKELTDEHARRFTAAMQSQSLAAAVGASRSYDWSQTKSLLDVGGGSGCFAIAIAQRHNLEKITVADLPIVCSIAQEYIKKFKVENKVDTYSLDMFLGPWPTNYDGHFFSNIFHDWDFDTCYDLATKSYNSLLPGGKIFLHEMLLRPAKDGDLTVACYSLHMLIHTKGKQFSADELEILLSKIGFIDIQVVQMYGYYSLIIGTKPMA